MLQPRLWPNTWLIFVIAAAAGLAQDNPGGAAEAPVSAKASAPVDLTGYWVSQVTGDWRLRMVTPKRGDYTSMPLNQAARKIADAWDPAKDEAAGEQCKSYGAPALMRVPGRIHITWLNDQTLKLEMDSGQQTRLFYFGSPESKGGDWQGVSKASWEFMPGRITSTDGGRASIGSRDRRAGSLKVVTTNFKPGYLRKNGVPYSTSAVLTEYFDRLTEPNGDTYILVSTTVEDPMYLNTPLLLSNQFKKLADANGWNPAPCTSR